MNVAELKELLNNYPDDMLVVISGFDGCEYDDIGTLDKVKIKQKPQYTGHHTEPKYLYLSKSENQDKGFEALHINF